ncbi:hypothetical protein LINPERHAP1_LOCUS8765 [Linum perenne]
MWDLHQLSCKCSFDKSCDQEFEHFVHLTEFDLSDNNISVLPAELVGIQFHLLPLFHHPHFSEFNSLFTALFLPDGELDETEVEEQNRELMGVGKLCMKENGSESSNSIWRPILERGTKAVLQYLKNKLPEQQ